MNIRNRAVKDLLEYYKEISLLGEVSSLLGWDMNVNLPSDGASRRAEQSAYMTKLITDKWLDPTFKKTLEKAKREKLNLYEKAIVRNLTHSGKYYFRVPQELIVEYSRSTSEAFMAWQEARIKNDFAMFSPHLMKLVEMNRLIAGHIGYKENPYDALLDLFEPGLTAKYCSQMFTPLTRDVSLLLRKIVKSKRYTEGDKIRGNHYYRQEDQERIALLALRKIGYNFERGRQDVSSHPFTDTLGPQDVRVTNRYKDDDFVESLMVAMHEGGHALYEQGVSERYWGTPLSGGVSLGVHESQSRFWENQIGRSLPFVGFIEPTLRAFYGKELSGASTEDIYFHFNAVTPSLIRVEADEVTYNLHIALRFELENALMNGKVKVPDLPKAWNKLMKKYLGVTPDTDATGVLQDVHWSHGLLGYFPTYTLGNLYAAQFADAMGKEIDIISVTGKGELSTILSWLRDNIHTHGSLYYPDELINRVTGKKLSAKYLVSYLEKKYSKLYSL